jgi:uncharacterized protein (TIGR03435 family)
MSDLAGALSTFISMQEGGMPAFATNVVHVVDKTGLSGAYDFTLKFYFAPAVTETPSTNDVGMSPTVYSALEQQLGLKLQKMRAPLPVIVIDSAQKTPTEN